MKQAKPKSKPKATKAKAAVLGGQARDKSLTGQQKSEIGRAGAAARWRGKPIRAEFSGVLRLGLAEIPCANLPGGRRVIAETAILNALGRTYSGYYSQRDAAAGAADASAEPMHRSVSPKVLHAFIPADLATMLQNPIAYQAPDSGSVAKGIPAEALPMILDVWIQANLAGVLTAKQAETAERARILRDGFTQVGIAAMVDEATGAQYARARFAMAQFLESYVTRELAAWERMFEDEFYKEMFRLRGWDVADLSKRPGVVGKWTADIIYSRLAPGVLERLQEIVPRDSKGRLKHKFHQALTRDRGYIALKVHISSVNSLMFASKTWDGFMELLDSKHPKYDAQILLPFMNAVTNTEDETPSTPPVSPRKPSARNPLHG